MHKQILTLLIVGFLSLTTIASYTYDIPKVKTHKRKHKAFFKFKRRTIAHNKWVAAGLDISLGFFGVHRLYLGTEVHVPVMYTLTLGGGGVLVLADLGLLIFTKDVETFSGNSRIFMWSE